MDKAEFGSYDTDDEDISLIEIPEKKTEEIAKEEKRFCALGEEGLPSFCGLKFKSIGKAVGKYDEYHKYLENGDSIIHNINTICRYS